MYPSQFIKKLQVGRIYFSCNFRMQDAKGILGGTVDASTNSLFYNVVADRNKYDLSWLTRAQIHVIHHELFHFIDHRLRLDIQVDPEWEKLNPPSFSYFKLDKWDAQALHVTSLFPGFITRYAENSVAEDKAETFGYMLVNLHEMECRAKDDPLLGKKLSHLKQELKTYSAKMDESFWTRIRYLNRTRLTDLGDSDPWAIAHPTLPPLPKLEEPAVTAKNETTCVPVAKRSLFPFKRTRYCR